MSIEAISWAWKQQVTSTQKLVLLALADGADQWGEAKLSQGFLCWQTELKERAVREALKALETDGLITRLRAVRRDGTRGVDRVLLDLQRASAKGQWAGTNDVQRALDERRRRDGLPAGHDLGPDLVETPADVVPSGSHRHEMPVDEPAPVDNSIAPSGNHRQEMPVEGSYRHLVPVPPALDAGSHTPGHLPTTRGRLFPSSSSAREQEPATTIDDDDAMTVINPNLTEQAPRIHRGVDLRRLAMECGSAAGVWTVGVWAATVDVILGRASGRVSSPQRFVTAAIQRDPTVVLDGLETANAQGTHAGPAESDATLPAPVPVSQYPEPHSRARARAVSCPVHHTDHLEGQECGGCRADRLTCPAEEG